ncbi:MAG: YdcF family protein [Acidobacteriota bacterium]|nr:YdcF family protein [Acidobacteriota bacterium]
MVATAELCARVIPYNVVIRITQIKRAITLLTLAAATFALGYLLTLSIRIGKESRVDEAQPADVIVVMGAAEYRGHPSPVLKLRLDHAVQLYNQHLAPYIMTTGGPGGDPSFTEGGVGRSYLIDRGVPPEAIVVETEGDSTVYSLSAAAEIFRRMGLHSCIIVSDGYHIFRVKRILEQEGFTVYGSPREAGDSSEIREWWLYFRQAVGYGLWKIGVRV